MNDRIVLPIGAVGTGKLSWNLLGGYQIASIQIDNPTGSWLQIKEDDTLIAPWTIGVIHNFNPTLASVTILFVAGPASKPSIQQGDAVTLFISSDHDLEFVGTPFTPVSHTQSTTGTLPLAASLTNIGFTGANAGRHIYSIQVDNPSGLWLQVSGYGYTIPPNTVGWTRTLPDGPTSVTITSLANGPDGSPSVAVGTPPTLTIIDDLSLGNTPGSAYVPVVNSQIFTTVAFGNLGVTQFTAGNAGRFIAGVIIDNPSGSWLTLNIGGAAYRVAPYQLRWVKAIQPPAASITSLTFDATGPANQVSTKQGDQVTLTILDQPPDPKDTSFIDGFTPIQYATISPTVPVTAPVTNQTIIAGVANKRIRLLSLTIMYSVAAISPVVGTIQDSGATTLFGGQLLTQNYPVLPLVFPSGFDLGVGLGLVLSSAISIYITTAMTITASYQLI